MPRPTFLVGPQLLDLKQYQPQQQQEHWRRGANACSMIESSVYQPPLQVSTSSILLPAWNGGYPIGPEDIPASVAALRQTCASDDADSMRFRRMGLVQETASRSIVDRNLGMDSCVDERPSSDSMRINQTLAKIALQSSAASNKAHRKRKAEGCQMNARTSRPLLNTKKQQNEFSRADTHTPTPLDFHKAPVGACTSPSSNAAFHGAHTHKFIVNTTSSAFERTPPRKCLSEANSSPTKTQSIDDSVTEEPACKMIQAVEGLAHAVMVKTSSVSSRSRANPKRNECLVADRQPLHHGTSQALNMPPVCFSPKLLADDHASIKVREEIARILRVDENLPDWGSQVLQLSKSLQCCDVVAAASSAYRQLARRIHPDGRAVLEASDETDCHVAIEKLGRARAFVQQSTKEPAVPKAVKPPVPQSVRCTSAQGAHNRRCWLVQWDPLKIEEVALVNCFEIHVCFSKVNFHVVGIVNVGSESVLGRNRNPTCYMLREAELAQELVGGKILSVRVAAVNANGISLSREVSMGQEINTSILDLTISSPSSDDDAEDEIVRSDNEEQVACRVWTINAKNDIYLKTSEPAQVVLLHLHYLELDGQKRFIGMFKLRLRDLAAAGHVLPKPGGCHNIVLHCCSGSFYIGPKSNMKLLDKLRVPHEA